MEQQAIPSRRMLPTGALICAVLLGAFSARRVVARSQQRVIEVIADHDSRFKIAGLDKAVIRVGAGEAVHLKITAVKAKNHDREGNVHGFTLLKAHDRSPVPGWDFLLKPGVQEFDLTAPSEPGEYIAVCTVICSGSHEQMTMKFIVEPNVR